MPPRRNTAAAGEALCSPVMLRLSFVAIIVCLFFFYRSSVPYEAELPTGLHDARPAHPFKATQPNVGAAGTGTRRSVSRRVVAVADLHGDIEHALNVLRMAKVVDADGFWIAGHDILASTGDIVDRGDDTIKLYQLFDRLRVQAEAVGGSVRQCYGNHEMMNALGDWRYVTKGDIASFGDEAGRRKVISTQGWIGQTWLDNYSATQTVPLLPAHLLPSSLPTSYRVPNASFVHGGITPAWAAQGIEHINAVGRSLLHRALDEASPTGWFPDSTPKEEREFYGDKGPLWYRGYATEPEAAICGDADRAAESLGVRHLIMGHTPHFDGFVVRCKGKILLIDTGISRAYGGEQSALIIDTELAPLADGTWEEREVLTALYRGRKPRIIDQRTQIIK